MSEPTSPPVEEARTLTELLRVAVDRDPTALAVESETFRLSFEALYAEVQGLAGAIAERCKPGDRIAVCTARGPEATLAMHAVLAARGVAVPVSLNPAARARAVLDDCGAALVVADEAHRPRASGLGLPTLTTKARGRAPAEPAPDDLAYILYTSGSTGRPKGVTWDHLGAVAFPRFAITRLALAPSDRVAAVAPLGFDLSTFDLYAALGAGARVLFPPHEALLFPQTLAGWIEATRPTVLYAVPTLWAQLAAQDSDLSSLRAVIFAGEVFPIPALAALRERLPRAHFENFYGPTETNVCTAYRVEQVDADAPPIPIGTVVPYLDAVAPVEGRGELIIEGDAIMRGYWGALGAKGRRRHATGDLVQRGTDGVFSFHGRIDRMVKVRGHRVELGDVEHALARHPALREVAVVMAGGALRAYFAADGELTDRELRAHAARQLPAYMVPHELVRVAELPRTNNGKVALQELT